MKTPIGVLKTHLALDTARGLANLPRFMALDPSADQRPPENPRSWWNVNAECRIAHSREGLNQYIAHCLRENHVTDKDLPEMPDANAGRYRSRLKQKLIKTCGRDLDAKACKTLRIEAETIFSALSGSEADKVGKEVSQELVKLNEKYQNAKRTDEKERLVKTVERGNAGDWMKNYRQHTCQVCKELGMNPVGFRTKAGLCYTEAHHVDPVSAGGSLGLENIIVVCANHHRQMHYGNVELLQTAKGNSEFIFRIDGKEIRVERFHAHRSD